MVTEEELKNMSPEEIRKLQEENCVFCKIGRKEIPSKVIYEDDVVIAFLDIQPLSMGHTLLTTKKHHVFFSQLSDEETAHIFKVAQQISRCLLKTLQRKGTNITVANGEVAGQMAPHFIIHIIPRTEDAVISNFHPIKEEMNDSVLKKIQDALVGRIEEVMKIDMRSVIEARREKVTEKKADKEDNKKEPTKKENKEEPKKETEVKNKKESTVSKKEDIDLDKISELFK